MIRAPFSIRNSGDDIVRILDASSPPEEGVPSSEQNMMTWVATRFRYGLDDPWQVFRPFDLGPGQEAAIEIMVTQQRPSCGQGYMSWGPCRNGEPV